MKKFPFAVVTPQCRFRTLWDAEAVKQICDTLLATGRFDPRRISITGTGMGAFTAWYLLQRYPGYFAAAIPINGGGDAENICAAKKTALWVFHGARHETIPFTQSKNMVAALRECGRRRVEFSVYTEQGAELHEQVYRDPRIYDWLKRQRQ